MSQLKWLAKIIIKVHEMNLIYFMTEKPSLIQNNQNKQNKFSVILSNYASRLLDSLISIFNRLVIIILNLNFWINIQKNYKFKVYVLGTISKSSDWNFLSSVEEDSVPYKNTFPALSVHLSVSVLMQE